METFRSVFYKPDPAAEKRKCNAMIRRSQRDLEREMSSIKASQRKLRPVIKDHFVHGRKDQALLLARSIADSDKRTKRIAMSSAQLSSVQMQIEEAYAMRKIQGSLKSSASIMKSVNGLIRLGEVTKSMQELSQELMRAGIIDEMVNDMLPGEDILDGEQETTDAEVEQALREALTGEKGVKGRAAEKKVPQQPTQQSVEEELAEAGTAPQEEALADMRGRLEALKS